ncbi:MAG: sugar ABC transporter permease [Spirochaetaceae bacterium]|jgi:arabinogalactan oligomer/maltooligosaccharide transport system permease protein|nr:sugar ABC transporter permease [Spirochaetaceae bacterium]
MVEQRRSMTRGRTKVLIVSLAFMGLGHIVFLKQYLKGILLALIELGMILFSPRIVEALYHLITLGTPKPDLPIRQRDNSVFMLIDGVMMLAVLGLYLAVYAITVRSALRTWDESRTPGRMHRNKNPFNELLNKAFPLLGLSPAVLLILFFVVVPLVFSVLVAFTNYSTPDHIPPNNTVDWVGVQNFVAMFGGEKSWTGALGRVALWTAVWAALATATCYLGGTLLAVVLHESKIKVIPFFRTVFILPYAVPAVVSMLVWQNLLNGSFGTVNRTLMALHILKEGAVIPWLSNQWLAKFTCVLVNFWAGVPYFMLLVTGTLTAIPQDIYEASSIDGANSFQRFFKITLPLVLYQTMPLIIMSFTFNINNFGAIFFLTGGAPIVADTTTTSAAGTDILVTWIYKLTITLMDYKYASVLAVMIFIVLAPFAIFNFRRTKSFKEGRV